MKTQLLILHRLQPGDRRGPKTPTVSTVHFARPTTSPLVQKPLKRFGGYRARVNPRLKPGENERLISYWAAVAAMAVVLCCSAHVLAQVGPRSLSALTSQQQFDRLAVTYDANTPYALPHAASGDEISAANF